MFMLASAFMVWPVSVLVWFAIRSMPKLLGGFPAWLWMTYVTSPHRLANGIGTCCIVAMILAGSGLIIRDTMEG